MNAWPYGAPERQEPNYRDDVVVWTAERLETGEQFSMVAKATYPLANGTPLHAEVPRSVLDEGATREAFIDAWRGFLLPTDVLCSWGHHAPALLFGEGGTLPDDRLDIRSVSRLAARGKVGTIEEHGEVVNASGASSLVGYGRAARRLALLTGITRHLQTLRR